jgi:hypothetical protein
MRLVACLCESEDALRADLQRYYGIDLDHAMNGAHTPRHIAALVNHLPPEARIYAAEEVDNEWTLEHVLLADIRNIFSTFVWGMSDKKKRGARPPLIGPSWMTKKSGRKLAAQVMTVDDLMRELSKPRHNTKEVNDGE